MTAEKGAKKFLWAGKNATRKGAKINGKRQNRYFPPITIKKFPYVGITQIRFKGSKLYSLPLSLQHKLPHKYLIFLNFIIMPVGLSMIGVSDNLVIQYLVLTLQLQNIDLIYDGVV